jgi:hypothetical protein
MSIKEKFKEKKDKVVEFVIDHQLEVVQTVGALIATGAFVVRTCIKKNNKDDDNKNIYNIDNYYKIENYYEKEKPED